MENGGAVKTLAHTSLEGKHGQPSLAPHLQTKNDSGLRGDWVMTMRGGCLHPLTCNERSGLTRLITVSVCVRLLER